MTEHGQKLLLVKLFVKFLSQHVERQYGSSDPQSDIYQQWMVGGPYSDDASPDFRTQRTKATEFHKCVLALKQNANDCITILDDSELRAVCKKGAIDDFNECRKAIIHPPKPGP